MIDEIESTLMEVVRKNKPIRYIPEHMIPRDPETGRYPGDAGYRR